MAEEQAQRQGVFIPNWWLAILLMPLAGGVLWVIITLTSISANQTALQNTLEFRLKQVETQAKLNDEHERERQIDQARLQGEVDALTKIFGSSQKIGRGN